MTLRILTVVGARPQFIKAAAVSRAIAAHPAMNEIMVHTGQHYDDNMSKIFFNELEISPPTHQLGVRGESHAAMTGRMLEALEQVMLSEQPDWVMVYGDTNSTLAGALAAAKLLIPVAHVEAGLRSFDLTMPEEINRIVADRVSRLLFCPTRIAVENLKRESVTAGVHHVGDVMYDAALHVGRRAREQSRILEELKLDPGSYAVATVHRAGNTDDPAALSRIVAWLLARAREHKVVFPVHPRTRKALALHDISTAGLMTIPPVGYLDMARLLDGAVVVYTDSGGLQKEAYFHGKPCVTLREETEWLELVECGWNRLWMEADYRPRKPVEDYGTGQASMAIVETLVQFDNKGP